MSLLIVAIRRFDDDPLGLLLVRRCMLRILMMMFALRHWENLRQKDGILLQVILDDMLVLLTRDLEMGEEIHRKYKDWFFGVEFTGIGEETFVL